MSVIIPLAELTEAHYTQFIKDLTLQPVNKEEEEQKKWNNSAPRHSQSAPTAIQMYDLTDDKKGVKIPFFYACKTFGHLYNQNLPHHRVINSYQPPFEAQLREQQYEPANTAYQLLSTFNSVTIGLPPGFGKTIIGAWLWYLMGFTGLVFSHRDTICRQWHTSFTKCIPGIAHKIWIVGETPAPAQDEIPAIIICMYGRYKQIPEELLKKIGTLIVDEAHLFCTPDKVSALLAIQPRYIIMESATLERDDGMHKMIQLIAGDHGVFKVSEVPYSIYCVETGILVPEQKTSRGVITSELRKSLASDSIRNEIIIDIIKQNLHKKFMVLTRVADHVPLIQKLLLDVGITSGTLYRSKSSYNDSRVLIGTVDKMGTGFDEANGCVDFGGEKSNVIIITHSIKKWQVYEQLRGRVMRSENPIVIWLNDRNKMVRRHFKGLESWFEETKGTVTTIHYSPATGLILP